MKAYLAYLGQPYIISSILPFQMSKWRLSEVKWLTKRLYIKSKDLASLMKVPPINFPKIYCLFGQ